MFNYALINGLGYCIGLSVLVGEVNQSDMVLLDSYDTSYLNRKYDINKKEWLNEYYTPELIKSQSTEDEQLTTINQKLNKIIEHLGIQA